MKKLLIVEDDLDIQDFYGILFAGLGVEILRAFNGPEGLAVIDSGVPVDLVLLDMVLPGMGGEEVFRALRLDRGSLVPVILCSADERMAGPLKRIGTVQGIFSKSDPGSLLVDMIRAQLGL